MTNREKARIYFGIENNPEIILHYKDDRLKYDDPNRYNEWRIEDLQPMTQAEHMKLHKTGKKLSEEARNNISKSLTGRPKSEEHRLHISENSSSRRPEVKAKISASKKVKNLQKKINRL